MQFILASSSPARLATLRAAGVEPEVVRPEVDEDAYFDPAPGALAQQLAIAKAEQVAASLEVSEPTVVVGCDSLLEFSGKAFGKPGTPEEVILRWYRMRGRAGFLHTGHHVIVLGDGPTRSNSRLGSTLVRFADLTDAEIAAYAATGEPERVAGAFTIDGLGGPFITRIEGDPHNVVGLSLPLLRQMLLDLGVAWHLLWANARV